MTERIEKIYGIRKPPDQEGIRECTDDSQVQIPAAPTVTIKKKYKNKRIAPCIQCCGERRAASCTESTQCEEWREYANRRSLARKAREYNRIRVSRSLYLIQKV